MSDPLDVPRPVAAGPSDFAERLRALRSDARVGAAVLACVAIAAGRRVVPRRHRAVGADGAARRRRPSTRRSTGEPTTTEPDGHDHDDAGARSWSTSSARCARRAS